MRGAFAPPPRGRFGPGCFAQGTASHQLVFCQPSKEESERRFKRSARVIALQHRSTFRRRFLPSCKSLSEKIESRINTHQIRLYIRCEDWIQRELCFPILGSRRLISPRRFLNRGTYETSHTCTDGKSRIFAILRPISNAKVATNTGPMLPFGIVSDDWSHTSPFGDQFGYFGML